MKRAFITWPVHVSRPIISILSGFHGSDWKPLAFFLRQAYIIVFVQHGAFPVTVGAAFLKSDCECTSVNFVVDELAKDFDERRQYSNSNSRFEVKNDLKIVLSLLP